MGRTFKGVFTPKHPEKYKGNVDNIIFRSSWEKKVMIFLDSNPSVIEWSSEELVIPYICATDGRWHRYFTDFVVKAVDYQGNIKTQILEVKPDKETRPPTKRTRNFESAMRTFLKNQSKWKFATEYAKQNGMEFKIVTEYSLGMKKKK